MPNYEAVPTGSKTKSLDQIFEKLIYIHIRGLIFYMIFIKLFRIFDSVKSSSKLVYMGSKIGLDQILEKSFIYILET